VPLVAVLQVGPAIAPTVPQFNQGEDTLCQVSFFDSVTQLATDPDGSAITGQTQNPDGSVTTLVCTRQGQGTYTAPVSFLQAGTYGLQFNAAQAPQEIELLTQVSVVALYVSPQSLTAVQWTFVTSAQSPYQANIGQPFLAVDLRGGPVTIDFWTPADGDEITVKDWYNLAGTTPLEMVAGTGLTLEVPGAAGTYTATARALPPPGTTVGFEATYKYSLAAQAWARKTA
jgi:hypothetical protein